MRYEHVVAAVFGEVWAILPEKLREIAAVIAFRAAGQAFSADEIRANLPASGQRAPASSGRGVGVIPIHGTISHRIGTMAEASGGVSVERIGADLRAMLADDSIGTILLDIDSPGGEAGGVFELGARIREATSRKPVWAHAGDSAFSAAYALASPAQRVALAQTGGVGSIVGCIGGILVLGVINNGLLITGVSPYLQKIIKGAIIVIAVVFDMRKIARKK